MPITHRINIILTSHKDQSIQSEILKFGVKQNVISLGFSSARAKYLYCEREFIFLNDGF